MRQKYIGIENELVSFKGGHQISFDSEDFKRLRDIRDYKISSSSIRTTDGLGFYVDGNEIEILTPPIPINKGFSTRLTDSLIYGRDKVLDASPRLKHTGYSMHWNLSYTNFSEGNFYKQIAIPFHLFGLTPLSKGMGVRNKPGRIEILGDSINNKDQINATALLLGSCYMANYDNRRFPIEIVNAPTNTLFLPDGRFNDIEVRDSRGNLSSMQVQEYIERFHRWLTPCINELGGIDERDNLKSFISGAKELEFDKFKYFAEILYREGKGGGVYMPIKLGQKNLSQIIQKDGCIKREDLPLECKLLGELVLQKKDQIRNMTWHGIEVGDRYLDNIESIYQYAQSLNEDIPPYEPSANLSFTPSDFSNEIDINGDKIQYNLSKDKSFNDKGIDGKGLVLDVIRVLGNYDWKRLAIAGGVALAISLTAAGIKLNHEINKEVNKLEIEHSQNYTQTKK